MAFSHARPPLVALLAFILTACGASDDGTLERIREEGVVRVGFADEAPYAYLNDRGELVGSEVSLARAVFSRLGVPELDPVNLAFSDLIPALEEQRVDVVIAGMFITPDRCRRVAFSDPTYAAPTLLGVAHGNPMGLHNYSDALRANAVVGVLAGSVEAEHARDAGLPPNAILELGQPFDLVDALARGTIDAFVLTSPSVRSLNAADAQVPFETSDPFIPIVGERPAVGAGGFAVRLESRALRAAVNEEVVRLRASGELDRLMAPFGLGERERQAAAGLSASELCRPME